MARHVQLSPSYLSLLFHRECRCTFISYPRHRRISTACQLLQDLQLPVADVAARVGCFNIGHFYRLFRKVTGVTPGTFREAFKEWNRGNPKEKANNREKAIDFTQIRVILQVEAESVIAEAWLRIASQGAD